jgi:hypothetical protein
MSIATKLATFNDNSLRYHFAKVLWSDQSIRNSRVCVFYCLMLTSAFIIALALLLGFGILVILAWLCGFTITRVKDQGGDEKPGSFWVYKHSRHTGGRKRFAPWQILLPTLIGLALITGHLVLLAWLVAGVAAVFLTAIGMQALSAHAIRHSWDRRLHDFLLDKQRGLSVRWRRFKNSACPKVQVQSRDRPVSRSG